MKKKSDEEKAQAIVRQRQWIVDQEKIRANLATISPPNPDIAHVDNDGGTSNIPCGSCGRWGARHRWGGVVAQVEGYVWMRRRRLAAAGARRWRRHAAGGGSSRGVVPRAVLFFMSWPRVGEGEQAREPALSIQLRKCTYVGIRT